MVMGSLATMDLWDPTFLATLAERYMLVLYDHRGMGASSGSGPYEFGQLADDAAGLIQALNIGPTNVLGWSMGGSVVLDLALRYPELVKNVVSYAGDCGGPNAVNPPDEIWQAPTDPSGTPEEQGERLLGLLFPQDWLQQNFAYVLSVFDRPTEPIDPQAVELQVKAIFEWPGIYDQLGNINVPVMIVQGTADVITPPENGDILANGIPGSWLIRFANGGHGLQSQEPRRFARLVMNFFGDY